MDEISFLEKKPSNKSPPVSVIDIVEGKIDPEKDYDPTLVNESSFKKAKGNTSTNSKLDPHSTIKEHKSKESYTTEEVIYQKVTVTNSPQEAPEQSQQKAVERLKENTKGHQFKRLFFCFPDPIELQGEPDWNEVIEFVKGWGFKEKDVFSFDMMLVVKAQKELNVYAEKIDKVLGNLLKDHEQIKKEDILSILPNAIGKELKEKWSKTGEIGPKLHLDRSLAQLIFKANLEIPKMFLEEKELKKTFWDLYIKTGRKPYPLLDPDDPDDNLKDVLKARLDEIIEEFRILYPEEKSKGLISTECLRGIYDELVYEYVQYFAKPFNVEDPNDRKLMKRGIHVEAMLSYLRVERKMQEKHGNNEFCKILDEKMKVIQAIHTKNRLEKEEKKRREEERRKKRENNLKRNQEEAFLIDCQDQENKLEEESKQNQRNIERIKSGEKTNFQVEQMSQKKFKDLANGVENLVEKKRLPKQFQVYESI